MLMPQEILTVGTESIELHNQQYGTWHMLAASMHFIHSMVCVWDLPQITGYYYVLCYSCAIGPVCCFV